jgi:charged multivesicular body protein 7
MKVYESSTATLRAILAHPSLQRDSIDHTMDALAEANTDAKEVDDAVRIGVDSAVNADQVDEDELEAELNKLIEEARAQEIKAGRVEEKLGKPTLTVPRDELEEVGEIAAQPIV